MKPTPTLQVLVCTINEGIGRIADALCAPREDVGYVVSWQITQDAAASTLPQQLIERKDVCVVTLRGKGLSANRNNALRHATAPLLLIADDDCRYCDDYFNTIIRAFSEKPEADILAFQGVDEDGRPMRNYPKYSFEYRNRPRFTYFTSWELALRNSPRLPRFDVRFGLGSDYLACGEEEIFVHEASLRGLKIFFIPETIVSTRRETTGKRFETDSRVQRSKGAVLCILHGAAGAFLRSLKEALQRSRLNPVKFFTFFIHLCQGIRYACQPSPCQSPS